MSFASLATAAGERYAELGILSTCLISCSAQRFRNSCEKAGKGIMVWTVNEVEHMMEVRLFLSDVIRQTGSLNPPRPPVDFTQKGGKVGSKGDPDRQDPNLTRTSSGTRE